MDDSYICVWRLSLSMILKIFLFFVDFEPGDSYKDYSYKKTVYSWFFDFFKLFFAYFKFSVIFWFCRGGSCTKFRNRHWGWVGVFLALHAINCHVWQEMKKKQGKKYRNIGKIIFMDDLISFLFSSGG